MPRVLFDHSVPRPLARYLPEWEIETAQQRGWDTLTNRKMLTAIEVAGFDVFLTYDQNLRYQQNTSALSFAIVVIGTNLWPVIASNPLPIVQALGAAARGSLSFVSSPKLPRERSSV